MRPCEEVTYITPSTTSGVVFWASSTPKEKDHTGTRRLTVRVSIWLSGLKRVPA